MVRKIATAALVLALLLIGYQPVKAPMANVAMAAAMDAQPPCCADCDQPAMPGMSDCGAMAGCAVSPSVTILTSSSMPVFFPARVVQLFPDQSAAISADVSPPFRPPRSLILA